MFKCIIIKIFLNKNLKVLKNKLVKIDNTDLNYSTHKIFKIFTNFLIQKISTNIQKK